MTTSPIAALSTTAPSPSPGSGYLSAPADISNFHQALQQAKSGADSGVQSSSGDTSTDASAGGTVPATGTIISGTAPDDARNAVATATQAKNADANSFATHLKIGLADISITSSTKKEKTAGKTVASGTTSGSKTKVDAEENTQTLSGIPILASSYVVPVVASIANAQDSSSTQTSTVLGGAISANAGTFSIPSTDGSGAVSSNLPSVALVPLASASADTSPAAASFPAIASAVTASPEGSTTEAVPTADDSASRAAGSDTPLCDELSSAAGAANGSAVFPALVPLPILHSTIATAKAKPRVASSVAKANSAASATDTASGAASVSNASQPTPALRPVLVPETLADGKSNVSQSNVMPIADHASGDRTMSSGHARAQSKSERNNSSAAEEKASTPAASTEHDSFAAAAAVIAHMQPSPPPAPPAASTAETTQSATTTVASAVQSAAPASTQARPQIQANPIPDPPRMVDSGQLRVNPNSSELKISIQLPELGKIEVRAVTTHDVTTAHMTATRADALQLLATDRTGLEQALKARDVVLGSMNSHTQGQSDGQQRQQNSQSPAQSSGGISTLAAAPSSSTEAVSTSYLPDHASISVRA
jgi:hypothetical protein